MGAGMVRTGIDILTRGYTRTSRLFLSLLLMSHYKAGRPARYLEDERVTRQWMIVARGDNTETIMFVPARQEGKGWVCKPPDLGFATGIVDLVLLDEDNRVPRWYKNGIPGYRLNFTYEFPSGK